MSAQVQMSRMCMKVAQTFEKPWYMQRQQRSSKPEKQTSLLRAALQPAHLLSRQGAGARDPAGWRGRVHRCRRDQREALLLLLLWAATRRRRPEALLRRRPEALLRRRPETLLLRRNHHRRARHRRHVLLRHVGVDDAGQLRQQRGGRLRAEGGVLLLRRRRRVPRIELQLLRLLPGGGGGAGVAVALQTHRAIILAQEVGDSLRADRLGISGGR